ncbi:beta-1,3-galactosyltransferase 1-like [Saccostrea echinata]|uniref:beta-1,3-galactosyltransferase 1-like n=1 Tax=Saccostrea echinata TaxID=191078 RepID=UPI002A80DDD7|nr:beta-1,3-galactosyltransferase 1-like [Saccostrea echinata]
MMLRLVYFIIVCVVTLFMVFLSIRYTDRKNQIHTRKNINPNNLGLEDIDYKFSSNEHNFSYLISESEACQDEHIFLLVIVCVSPANSEQRQTIRETWGSVAEYDPSIKIMFLLGNPQNLTIQTQVIVESVQYHDIIQEDFIDSYRNLSIKSVALLRWVSQFCNDAEYVLKTDDDMFIHIRNLISILKNKNPTNAVIGKRINGAMPLRDEKSKWFTSVKEYSKRYYPPYCSGTAYVLSGDSVEPLYNVTQRVALFWLEDIYITGICRTIAKVDIIDFQEFTYLKRDPTACSYKTAVSGHRYSVSEIRQIWTDVQNNVPCPTSGKS